MQIRYTLSPDCIKRNWTRHTSFWHNQLGWNNTSYDHNDIVIDPFSCSDTKSTAGSATLWDACNRGGVGASISHGIEMEFTAGSAVLYRTYYSYVLDVWSGCAGSNVPLQFTEQNPPGNGPA